MVERLPESNDRAPATETAKGGGVGTWLRNVIAAVLGSKTVEKKPQWPGITLYAGNVEIKIITDGRNGFLIETPAGFIKTSISGHSVEEYERMKEALTNLSDQERGTLAQALRFTQSDDAKINDMRGAAGLMQDAFYAACRRKAVE